MAQLEMLLKSTMNKDKLLKGCIWISLFILTLAISAVLIFAGFNNVKYDDYKVLIIGLSLLPFMFYCAFRGIRIILSAIFE